MHRRAVVLPAPFGPRRPTISPGWMSMFKRSTARNCLYCLTSPWTSSIPDQGTGVQRSTETPDFKKGGRLARPARGLEGWGGWGPLVSVLALLGDGQGLNSAPNGGRSSLIYQARAKPLQIE